MKNKNLSSCNREIKQKNRFSSVFLVIIIIPIIVAGIFLLPEIIIASDITAENLIQLTNKERIKNGLKSLKVDVTLKKAANSKADHLIENEYFSHTSPGGKTFIEWIKETDYDYLYAGENLAMDFITAEGVIKAWMNSDSHKKNILSAYYTDIAIVAEETMFKNRPTTIIVQMFGRPKKINNSQQLTISNFNDIIQQNSKQGAVILPDCLDYENINLIYFQNNNSKIDKIVLATIENRVPYKVAEINSSINFPKVAGEHAQLSIVETNPINKNIAISFVSIFILIISIKYIREIDYIPVSRNEQIHYHIKI